MKRYGNLSGNSGVVAYEIGPDFIRVWFTDGDPYKYTIATAGAFHVAQMKKLAIAGQGLSGYIATYRPGYELED